MSYTKISENVYSVGVQDPNLRVFDIVMKANYGTTYNAFLIKDKKTVLVDNTHELFVNEYLHNVGSLIDIASVDYIVMNHTEPDHAGGLEKLIEKNPNLTVICTAAAKKNLINILNKELNFIVVKNGDVIDIGSTSLEFVVAPLLHWPDSMMTYYKKDKVLFSCDFLGAHFCSTNLFDTQLHNKDTYLEEFKYYFDAIFGPFKTYVQDGLKKIQGLDIKIICPSHGPILTESIAQRMNDYRRFSYIEQKHKKDVLIVYASSYGYTKQLALAAYKVISKKEDFNVTCIDMVEAPKEAIQKINNADVLLVGSCTINRDAPNVVWEVLSHIDAINTRGKRAIVFGSYGWSGEAVSMIQERLAMLNYKVPEEGYKTLFKPDKSSIEEFKDIINKFID